MSVTQSIEIPESGLNQFMYAYKPLKNPQQPNPQPINPYTFLNNSTNQTNPVSQTLQSLGFESLPSSPMGKNTNNPQSVGHEDTIIAGSVNVGINLIVQNDITSGHDVTAARNLTCGNQFITKDELVTDVLQVSNLAPRPGDTGIIATGNLTVLPQVGASPSTNGIISGNGGGLTNLPPTSISGSPDYTFQSDAQSFLPPYNPTVNYFLPDATEVIIPIACGIECDFAGKVPGIYFWKTRSTIQFQYLWNSSSGMIMWDGNRIYGEMSWSCHQATLSEALGITDPEYTMTRTVSPVITNPLDNPTAMIVVMESTNSSINPVQFSDYFVDFYRIGAFTAQVPAPSAPIGFAVTRVTGYDASITWVCPGATQYSCVLTPPGDSGNPQTTTTVRLNQSALTPSTSYSLVVTGANSGGSSPASNPFAFATNNLPSIVTGLVVSAITDTGFTLTFNPAQTPVGTSLTYDSTLTPSGGVATPGTNSFVFTGLSPSTYYTVTVTSQNGNGNSFASAPAFIKTSDGPPPPI